ncbi:MAG: ATP-binding protein [Clostridium sp.]|nr:ATP-binding protein [Clostridium sp.]
MLIKPNWDIFKAKFSENPQSNFEWFCYLLFCKEYGQEKGVFRYKNQSAIETNPIYIEEKIIGWQAKFYDTTLASNKAELIQTLQKAKRDYKKINMIIFYTNQEWGQGKQDNDSKAKKEVEEEAKELGIVIQWNTTSFFESPFVVEKNKEIATHFFTLQESDIDRVNKKIIPGVRKLNEQYKDTFKEIGGNFLKRKEIDICIEYIKQDKSILIHGKAGQGKSGCTQGIISYCESEDIPYIAIKLDDKMPEQDVEKWGEELGLTTSIPIALSMICEKQKGIIILDQLDALRWTQVHSRQALTTCMELIKQVEEINLSRDKKISIIFVCRTYDYENDPNIRSLFDRNDKTQNSEEESTRWEKVIVNELDEAVVRKIVGERYDKLSQKMKKVLSIPSNLYIWEHLEQDSMYDDYSTANQLIQKWWEQIKQKCVESQLDELEVETAKQAIIDKINMLGKLHINIKLLSGLKVTGRSLTYLSSSGFIVKNSNNVSFAHQSISDYFLAQEMLNRYYSGEDIIEIIGEKEKQTPQKRYQIQMLLQDIQMIEEEKLIQIGISLMESDSIRFYVKYVFFEVLGQSLYISDMSRKFILQYCDDPKFGQHVIEGVILGHAVFVQLLIDEGILDKWMEIDEKRITAIKLIQSISSQYRIADVEFIKRHLFNKIEDDKKLSGCFAFDIYKDTDEMFEVRMAFYEKYPSYIESYIDFKELFIKCEGRALKIFEFILKNELQGRRLYNNEERFLEEDNEGLIENTDLILNTLLVYVPQEKELGWGSKWDARESYNQGIERTCIQIIKKANRTLIERKPEEFINRYAVYFDKGYSVFNEIILEGFKSFPTSLSTQVIDNLNVNFNNLIFDKSSGEENELGLAEKVIEKHASCCEKKVYLKLEEKIMGYIDPNAKEWYKRRIEFNKDKGMNEYWSFWGDLQIELLGVLPKDRMTKKAKSILEVLKRRSYSYKEKNVYYRSNTYMHSGSVQSPIVGKRLSNKQWMQIITNDKVKFTDKSSSWDEIKGGFIESSIEEFSINLSEVVKQEPQRFIELLINDKLNINEAYINALFSGVAYSEYLDEIDNEILEKMILRYRYDYKAHRARYICDIVRKKNKSEWTPQILDMLRDIALNHFNPANDKPNVTTPSDKKMETFNMLETNALNCVRGSAAFAIGSLLWEHKQLYKYFKDTIAQLCKDINPAVRLATLDILFPVYNIDRVWAIEQIVKMLKDDYRLAGHREMKQMFFLIHGQEQEEIEHIILKCFYEKDKDLVRMGAYTLIEMYILRNRFTEVIDNVKGLNQKQVKYILEMVMIYFNKTEYNELAKQLIMKCMVLNLDLEFPICRIFNDSMVDIERDKEFLMQLVLVKNSKKIVRAFVRYLEKSNQPILAYKEIIFAMSYNIIENESDIGEYIYGLDEGISKLIIGIYDEASQEKDEEMKAIANECLHIWDLMFENRIGVARILTSKMLDR